MCRAMSSRYAQADEEGGKNAKYANTFIGRLIHTTLLAVAKSLLCFAV